MVERDHSLDVMSRGSIPAAKVAAAYNAASPSTTTTVIPLAAGGC